jgi:hypothetical protein
LGKLHLICIFKLWKAATFSGLMTEQQDEEKGFGWLLSENKVQYILARVIGCQRATPLVSRRMHKHAFLNAPLTRSMHAR